jgi:OmpA-OmpF porin, OOP family
VAVIDDTQFFAECFDETDAVPLDQARKQITSGVSMKTFPLSAALLALALASGGALAQGYAGVSIGQSKVDLDCTGTTSCDRSDTAFKIFGGYMFIPNAGVELTYYNQGKATLAGTDPLLGNVTGEYKGDGFGVYGVAVAPFGNGASVFGKLGMVSGKIKLDATSSVFGSASDSERHTNVAWGVGAGYEFTKNIGARLEFERVRVKFQGEKDDVDLVTLGLVYRF